MVRGPYDTEGDEPPGGRAAERLKDFLRQRFPEGVPPGSPLPEHAQEEPTGGERDGEQVAASDRHEQGEGHDVPDGGGRPP